MRRRPRVARRPGRHLRPPPGGRARQAPGPGAYWAGRGGCAPGSKCRDPGVGGRGDRTGLASMLFLVNFVVWLDDRADAPWPAGWALVELLGRYLLGDQLADFAGDPLWDVLAELDGRRPGTVPDVGLGPGIRPLAPGLAGALAAAGLRLRRPSAPRAAGDLAPASGLRRRRRALPRRGLRRGTRGRGHVAGGCRRRSRRPRRTGKPLPGRRFDGAVGGLRPLAAPFQGDRAPRRWPRRAGCWSPAPTLMRC